MLEKILDLSKKLISYPSVTSNYQALKSVLEEALKPLKEEGLTIESFERNQKPSVLIYQGNKRPKRFRLIFNGHLDVVSGKESQYRPFEKQGRLYGRGAIDMKSACAVLILVFKNVVKKINYPLALQLVTDEETGGFNGTKYQIEKGVRADFVIAGEPTDFGINNKAKGIIWMKVKTKGISAHGAYPWNGENALLKAQKIIEKIYRVYPLPKKESWQTTFNLARIETPNLTFNKVPAEATIFFDIRYIPEEFKNKSFKIGKKTFEKKIKKIIGADEEKEIILFEPPQFTEEKNSFILNLKKSIKNILKKNSKIIIKHGGSDIRHFNQVSCPGITFGPIGGGLHSDEEWIDIKSLEYYYKILEDYVFRLKSESVET
ncbi:MAG: M20/M25/M40 family metallo-hydrolase [Patescibacteria group bacterium]|nr:M20/M25/M40 family metallo-hydrolase [Patescibacteria group bacterium]